MSGMDHTPEPWRVGFGRDDHGIWITQVEGEEAVVYGRTEEDVDEPSLPMGVLRIEDARRIVAAVNACAGIPTETLESHNVGGLRLVREMEGELGLDHARQAATIERLRAALGEWVAAQEAYSSAVGPEITAAHGRLERAREAARAALAETELQP